MIRTLVTTSGKEPLKTLSVNVTKEIIEMSKRCNANLCMVAEAIHQKWPKAAFIFVDTSTIRFTLDGIRYWFLPPPKVKTFIAAYDRQETIKPFKFSTPNCVRVTTAGEGAYARLHPNGDNRTNKNKKYDPAKKKRRYAQRVRINGVCHLVPLKNNN